MSYEMRRVIIFTRNFAAMRDFYRDTFGLTVIEEDAGWADMAAGACRIAIHAAGPRAGGGGHDGGPHKVVFFAEDVAAAREDLLSRGVAMGPVKTFDTLRLCDGDDPDGNRIQLSNRA
jgi:catechol 2,3-dioxygenase-like lactoylglutathione lyase family enzyme